MSRNDWSSRAGWAIDLAAALVLTAINLALRWSYLRVPTFDTDESEYQAAAAYALSVGRSGFVYPIYGYTIEGYRLVAELFGKYNMLPVRLGVVLAASVVAGLIYVWLKRDVSRLVALATAASFSVFAIKFNGYMANREWPCAITLLLGAWLFVRAQRGPENLRGWGVFVAGFVAALSLYFKEQTAYIMLATPIWLVLKAVDERRLQPWAQSGFCYLAGGLAAGLLYVVPYAIEGTLALHIESELRFGQVYAFHKPVIYTNPYRNNWLGRFFVIRDARHQLLLAYGWLAYYLVRLMARWVRRWRGRTMPADDRRPRGWRSADTALLLTCYIATSAAAVAMGNRWSIGYFLLWFPFAALAGGYGLQAFVGLLSTRWRKRAPWIFAAFVALGCVSTHWTFAAAALVAGVLTVSMVAATRCNEPWRCLTPLACMAIPLGYFDATQSLQSTYRDYRRADVSEDVRAFFVARRLSPGERMFVWGSMPDLYRISGLDPSIRQIVCSGFDDSFFEPKAFPEEMANLYMAELRSRPPQVVVAGPEKNARLGGATPYPLDDFLQLDALIRSEYTRAASFPDCTIYERKSN